MNVVKNRKLIPNTTHSASQESKREIEREREKKQTAEERERERASKREIESSRNSC